jgi:hypothetical protein
MKNEHLESDLPRETTRSPETDQTRGEPPAQHEAPEDPSVTQEEETEATKTVSRATMPVSLDETDHHLLIEQIFGTRSVPPPGTEHEAEVREMQGLLALYKSIDPEDGIESMLSRVAVAVTKATMDSAARLAKSGDVPEIRKLNFKVTMEASLTLTKITEAMDRHRRLKQPRKTVQQFLLKR